MTKLLKTFDDETPLVPADLSEPELTETAQVVLRKRYLVKDKQGEPAETPRDLFWRVAWVVASQERNYPRSPYHDCVLDLAKEFYCLMAEGWFLPNSPTLMNAGRPLGQLAACFVLPIEDSMDGIFDAVKNAALIHKSGGGTGFSFSRLRPEGSRVGSTGGVASGPLSFLKIFDTATEQIKQGGTRRGANMGVLRVDHPDIEKWIEAKATEGDISNFNLSVGITDGFMGAALDGNSFSLIAPHTGEEVRKVNAKDLFHRICELAHGNGEPGVIFLDEFNAHNPTPELGEFESTNPCGEQNLLPYEACNLGSIDISRFKPWAAPNTSKKILKKNVSLAVRFLDDVIDASKYPLPEIQEAVQRTRKIGLGVMGFADHLFQAGTAYGSEDSERWAEAIIGEVRRYAYEASLALAMERGPYPACKSSSDPSAPRNASLTTIAPTGSLSMIAGCTSGIEPAFYLAQTKECLDGEKFVEVNRYFEREVRKSLSKDRAEEVLHTVRQEGYIPDELPEKELFPAFVIAKDISAKAHLRMQAAFQKYTDAAVSKTINLPPVATVQDVADIYFQAWGLGCKGVTVYRDGSRQKQVYTSGHGSARPQTAPPRKRPRPDVLQGFTQQVRTGLGKLYLTVNELDGRPFEVFATIGRSGRSHTAKAEAVGRLVSLCLRAEVPLEDIIGQLEGIGGEYPIFSNGRLFKSIPDAVGWILRTQYLDAQTGNPGPDLVGATCPDCGQELAFQEGCYICHGCGYTKCG